MRKEMTALSAAVVLALTACTRSTETPKEELAGTTGVRLNISFSKDFNQTRKVYDGQDKDVVGTDEENLVKDGLLYINDRTPVDLTFTVKPKQGNVWVSQIIETDRSGEVMMSPIINNNLGFNKLDFVKDKTVKIEQIEQLAPYSKDKGFVMTTTVAKDDVNKQTIQPDVKKPQEEGKNLFKFKLERVVAKAQVWAADKIATDEVEKKFGTLATDNLKWSLAGSAKESYLFADQAGDKSLTDEGLYAKDFKTISANNKEAGKYDLMKQSDYAEKVGEYKESAAGLANFKSRDILKEGVALNKEQDNGKSLEKGIYFLEHALNETKGASNAYEKTVTYGDIVYIKIYGKLTIKKGKKVGYTFATTEPKDFKTKAKELYEETQKDLSITAAGDTDFGERWYVITVDKKGNWYTKHKETMKDFLADKDDNTAYYLVHDKAGEFYASGDGANAVVYNSLIAALANGEKHVRKYWGGDKDFNVVYLTPANAQGPINEIYNCDTRRNNIYDLKLNSISGLGFNYDPNDPDKDGKPGDPNIPTPGDDNPLEPEPTNPPVNNTKTCLQVECTVLSWNLVQRALDLTGGTTGL